MTFSFIIPHYNTPELLARCLRSIPIRADVQVIVVDDCSPDNHQYLKQIPELSRPGVEFYITQIGGSAGRARNIGLQHARGQWVLFADADDYYAEGFLEAIEQQLKAETEILYFNVAGTNHRAEQHRQLFNLYLQTDDETQVRYHIWTPWNKVFSRRLIENAQLQFEEIPVGNDALFCLRASQLAKKYQIIDRQLYVLTDNDGSLTYRQPTFEREMAYAAVRIRINKFLASVGLQYKYGYNFISWARICRLTSEYGIINCLRYLGLVSRRYGLFRAISYYVKRKQFERQHPKLIYSD